MVNKDGMVPGAELLSYLHYITRSTESVLNKSWSSNDIFLPERNSNIGVAMETVAEICASRISNSGSKLDHHNMNS